MVPIPLGDLLLLGFVTKHGGIQSRLNSVPPTLDNFVSYAHARNEWRLVNSNLLIG